MFQLFALTSRTTRFREFSFLAREKVSPLLLCRHFGILSRCGPIFTTPRIGKQRTPSLSLGAEERDAAIIEGATESPFHRSDHVITFLPFPSSRSAEVLLLAVILANPHVVNSISARALQQTPCSCLAFSRALVHRRADALPDRAPYWRPASLRRRGERPSSGPVALRDSFSRVPSSCH